MSAKDDANEPIKFVRKDAFVMPVIPEDLLIDPVFLALLHSVCFLELSGDETVDPDWAVEAMEHIGYYLHRLDDSSRGRIEADLQRLVAFAQQQKLSSKFAEFLAMFVEGFGLRDKT